MKAYHNCLLKDVGHCEILKTRGSQIGHCQQTTGHSENPALALARYKQNEWNLMLAVPYQAGRRQCWKDGHKSNNGKKYWMK